MSKKKKNPRRENRVPVYLPLDLKEALDNKRMDKPIPESWSTFIANALGEWCDFKHIQWRGERTKLPEAEEKLINEMDEKERKVLARRVVHAPTNK